MFFTRRYIKKSIAGLLLIILLLIHSVKLLHTHSYFQTAGDNAIQVSKSTLPGKHVSAALQDCEICNYQLTKDTDNVFVSFDINTATVPEIFNTTFVPSFFYPFASSPESRGPPSTI